MCFRISGFCSGIDNINSNLAVCHWNENVGRRYTSVWTPAPIDNTRNERRKSKKALIACSYGYRDRIWDRYLNTVFSG
jgi:hypothetical protein